MKIMLLTAIMISLSVFKSRLLEQKKFLKSNNGTKVHPKSLEKYTVPLEVSSNMHQLLYGLTVGDSELLRSVHLQHQSHIKYISPSQHKRKRIELKTSVFTSSC